MANNFTFYSPTEIVFGRGTHAETARYVQKYHGSKVLVVYGSERVVQSGLLESVVAPMREAGLGCHLLGGVVPNPHLGKVYEGIELGKREGVDFLLAVGGGSVCGQTHGQSLPAGGLGADHRRRGQRVQQQLRHHQ